MKKPAWEIDGTERGRGCYLLSGGILRWVLVLSMSFLAVPSYSGMIGPPQPKGKIDQWVLGAGYFRAESRWKSNLSSGGTSSLQRNQVFIESSFPDYSFSEEGAMFFRVGVADIDDGAGFNDDYKVFGTMGIRDVWYQGEGRKKSNFKIGTITQASYYVDSEKTVGGTKATVSNNWEAAFAVIVQREAMSNRLLLYGGPYIQYGMATFRLDSGGASTSSKLKVKDIFGGAAGVRLSLPKRVILEVEGQFNGKSSVGTSLSYSF